MRLKEINLPKYTQIFFLFILIVMPHLIFSQEKTQVLGLINGEKIESKQIDEWLKNNPNNIVGGDLLTYRQVALNEIIARLVLLQDAKKLQLAEYSDNQFKYRMAQENILIELWFDNYFKTHPILEKDLLEEYNRQLSLTQLGGINAYQYQLTEIQLKTEREIKDVAQQLKLGADWMMLVKSKSAKPENSQKMSLIDWILPSQLIPPLGEVVRQLEIGKFNAIPVKTHLGWHLIRIEEQRAYVMPSFENLKQSITQSLLQKKRQEAVDDLLKRATIERVK